VGSSVIPEIIYATFNKFLLPPLIIQYDLLSLLFIIVVTVVLMIGVTVYFCHMELKQQPSVLLRPVSPKHGQKILLEKIGVIWRHLSFTWKVTMRNIFRYKQRVFMTMVGVAGCTALLLVGFGLRDSMSGVAQKQYGQIFNYKAMILLKDETTKINDDLNELLSKEKVQNPVLIKQTTFKTVSKQKKLDTYLLVPKDDKQFYQYYNLKSTLTGKTITLKKDGVVITQRLAEILGMKVGDKIEIQDMDNHAYSMTVADVTENYMMNYIYINPKLYSRVFGENASYNMIVSDFGQDETTLAKHLLDSDLVANVIYTSDILQKAVDGNKSFNNVVILLVVVASMLVIIVLYNLTSINISERKREIATLKVLGFTDKESNQYIYREAFVLTMLSVGIGLLLGIPLHRMLIDTIEGDASVYFKVIHGISFVWVALIIFIVTVIMQIITYIKMRTIDMIESLKAVE
jgi:putative ABC transport system permease protein